MEIRRVEGIIPLEGISRDLPLKLENFSFHDMKKLLSTISSGSTKKDMAEEFESLLIRATFEGYTPEGKAKLRSGKLMLIADVNVNREFKVGEELLLKLKSIFPKIELSLVEGKEQNILKALKNMLASFAPQEALKGIELLKDPFIIQLVISYLAKHAPGTKEEVEKSLKFLAQNGIPRKQSHLILSLLVLLEDENFEKVKEKHEKMTKETIKTAIQSLLSSFGFFAVTSLIVIPFFFEKEFKGTIYVPKEQDEIKSVFLEIETGEGTMGLLVKVGSRGDFSIDFFTDSETLKEKLLSIENEIREELKKEGFNLLYMRWGGDFSKGEEEKREFLKGEKGITINYSI